MNNYIITGSDAIAYAEAKGITLSKHADPTEGARNGITVDEALAIVAEDPSLIYLTLTGWTAGDGSGHEGYDPNCYFDGGAYRGQDVCGIEPIFA